MPNCFQLSRKTSEKFTAVSLYEIDEEMCKHFNVKYSTIRYYGEWYGSVGFSLAMGKSFEEIRKEFEPCLESDPDNFWSKRRLEIVDWLAANFVSDSWVQIGK